MVKSFQRSSKAQAALEFLMTYAWAFLGILIAIGGLYYFGFLDVTSLASDKCLFPSQFACVDSTVTEERVLLRLVNNIGEPVSMTSLDITSLDAEPPNCPDILFHDSPNGPSSGTPYLWPVGNTTDVEWSCSPGVYESGDRYEYIITFTYFATNSPSQTQHVMRGTVSGSVI